MEGFEKRAIVAAAARPPLPWVFFGLLGVGGLAAGTGYAARVLGTATWADARALNTMVTRRADPRPAQAGQLVFATSQCLIYKWLASPQRPGLRGEF